MAKRTRRSRRDIVQDLAIVLLSFSAILLFAQGQLDNLAPAGERYLERLVGGPSTPGAETASEALTALSAPVRVAVTGAYDRYGSLTLTTDSEDFADFGLLLRGALGAGGEPAASTWAEFQQALSGISVYYDFLSPLPLSVVAGLVGGDAAGGDISARYLILSSADGGTPRLLTWDGGEDFRSWVLPASGTELSTLAESPALTGVSFAFDDASLYPEYAAVAPCSLLPAELPGLPALSAGSALTEDTDWLLHALGFVPNTKNWYLESTGTKVVLESDRSLRIQPDGLILYQSGSDPLLTVEARGEVPTLREAATGAASLLERLLGDRAGQASLYLQSVTQTGASTMVTFGYQVGGVPIRFADGGAAGTVALSGGAVTRLSLRLRQYAPSGETSALLPLRQVVALAAKHPEQELSIGYADRGGNTVQAGWLAA